MPTIPRPGADRRPILLELDLAQPMIEVEPEDPIAKLRSRGKPRLRAVLAALHEAGSDDRVAGLVARIGTAALSMAQRQDLRDAVAAFAASGKPTIAWAETFGEGSSATGAYYLATAFGEIWLQPTGELNLLGLTAEVPFLGGVLAKLGVEPEFGRRYEYKNAVDTLTGTGFTPAHREAQDRLIASDWEQVVAAIAAARGLTEDEVRRQADLAPLLPADALSARLVDRLGYRDQVYAAARRAAGGDVKLLFADRWRKHETPVGRIVHQVKTRKAPAVALVEGHGGIVTGRSRRSPLQGQLFGADTVAAALRAATRDDSVKAIVFRVDSPGGSAVASDVVWREVVCAREAGKPVVVSMGTVAASGGYYVSCAADVIVAQPATITGSIGVFGGKMVLTGLTDKAGLAYGAVERGANALMYSTHTPFTERGRERLEATLDAIYADFTGKVAQGRGMTQEAVHAIAKGRVWRGADAREIGLVDELGGLRRAAAIARERAGLPADAPLRPAVTVPLLARLKPATSSDDPRAAATVGLSWLDGWGDLAAVARSLRLSPLGPVALPPGFLHTNGAPDHS